MTDTLVAPTGPARPTRRSSGLFRLTPTSGIGLGVALVWFSVLVLLPLAAVVGAAAAGGWGAFWNTLTDAQTFAALRLTVVEAALVTVVNAVIGTVVAWVLVRDKFFGKRILDVVIDIPFALPTIVAGLVLLTLYGPESPVGINIVNTREGIFLALLFVTLPFVVRTVQPVLIELDADVEEAAASLGASRFTTFRRIILPSLVPAITAGSSLGFARAISEFGSLVLISGNTPYQTEVASLKILKFIEGDNQAGAAAVAVLLLLVAIVTIVVLDLVARRVARRG
ncbi:sulfate ABC transporter permease subunit CysT [Pimelobacter simplex]|uniref:Sulfate transport system permease protein CysT n=1 Tax=Nocardioides simplex TaxID=2045 RepID=A0A0A1DQR3_NOCSI|nr:sulfate ABC transporter permease subunit CysT [Pimelobacter simplex]AIY19704.2 Sulfate transport system permease protein CysT [Pimelobacter simplex]MCG8151157.1 sulfate ABC transporter permease subunit CysT [Pimelobacter simplex]GEB12216.1 sulfate ABC transporter permease subunit CysT [Pimelobacter simplex]SFM98120.1 sulfate transport system permease protein [Pimelobacter simplex]